MRAISRRRGRDEQAASAVSDSGWTTLGMESRRRFHVVRAWTGSVLPAALATARSGAIGDAALLLVHPLRGRRCGA